MCKANVECQLVPPYDHCQNAAEGAIGIWKDHFVAGLASLDPNFPMHLWCRLIDQCTQTLNLMRASRINPRLSAEAPLNGAFDYNNPPLAPPGTKVLMHETPNRRRTWAVGRARRRRMVPRRRTGTLPLLPCVCYKNESRTHRSHCGVFPHYGNMPQLSSAYAAIRAAIDLCWTIWNPVPASPLAALGDAQMDAIKQLADIFNVSAVPAPPKPTTIQPPASAALPRVGLTPIPELARPPRVGLTPTPRAPSPEPHVIELDPLDCSEPASSPTPVVAPQGCAQHPDTL
jgi:hypothetical protein